jgi:hypothetical protein
VLKTVYSEFSAFRYLNFYVVASTLVTLTIDLELGTFRSLNLSQPQRQMVILKSHSIASTLGTFSVGDKLRTSSTRRCC